MVFTDYTSVYPQLLLNENVLADQYFDYFVTMYKYCNKES